MRIRTIGIFIMAIIVGFSVVLVARGANGMPMYVSPKTISDYQINIETEKRDMEKVEELVKSTKTKLAEYEALAGSDESKLQDRLLEEWGYFKMISGDSAVHGNGIIVYVDDGTRIFEGEDVNDILVHDRDILTIINDLKRSGAEAIAVNGQRIVDTSAISCAGYTIRINGQTYARPFEIRAVGDSKRMTATLVAPEGYATILKMYGVICKVTMDDDVIIPRYTEDKTYKYATKVEEGE